MSLGKGQWTIALISPMAPDGIPPPQETRNASPTATQYSTSIHKISVDSAIFPWYASLPLFIMQPFYQPPQVDSSSSIFARSGVAKLLLPWTSFSLIFGPHYDMLVHPEFDAAEVNMPYRFVIFASHACTLD